MQPDCEARPRSRKLVGEGQLLAFACVTTLFFSWAIAHNFNDILIKQFQKALELSYMQSGLIQTAFYTGYFLVAMPAGMLMQRVGYKNGILIGLGMYAFGAALFVPAAEVQSFAFFLVALFIIASGLTFLETAANPYVSAMGDPDLAAQRLNLAQSFNGLGAFLAPFIGGALIFSGVEYTGDELAAMEPGDLAAYRATEARAVQLPYLGLAAFTASLAIVIALVRLPRLQIDSRSSAIFDVRVLRFRQLRQAVVAQFFYVGAQVGIWSYFINFVQTVTDTPEKAAANYLGISLVFFMIGRFVGTAALHFVRPPILLAIYAAFAGALCVICMFSDGHTAVWALGATSFFMSIMFPTIFAMGIQGLGQHAKIGSSLLVMAIIGGALILRASAWWPTSATRSRRPCWYHSSAFLSSLAMRVIAPGSPCSSHPPFRLGAGSTAGRETRAPPSGESPTELSAVARSASGRTCPMLRLPHAGCSSMADAVSHDQNFKNLIVDYPRDALEFFAPAEAPGPADDVGIVPVRQEQLKDRLGAGYRAPDVPLLVKWTDGRRDAVVFALEEESDWRRFSPHRLARYCLDLAEMLGTDRVVPVTIFLRAAERAPTSLALGTERHRYLDFDYVACKLAETPAAHWLDSGNLVARLNLPNMDSGALDRVDVYASAVRGLFELEADGARQAKYLDFIDIYARLTDNEQRRYRRRYPEEARHRDRIPTTGPATRASNRASSRACGKAVPRASCARCWRACSGGASAGCRRKRPSGCVGRPWRTWRPGPRTCWTPARSTRSSAPPLVADCPSPA